MQEREKGTESEWGGREEGEERERESMKNEWMPHTYIYVNCMPF